jgi:hypothetical protein
VPPDRHPVPANRDRNGVVELEALHGGSTAGAAADDHRPVIAPTEVIRPRLAPWVEELDQLPGYGIDPFGLIPLVAVTESAGQPEILLVVGPATRLRHDVLNFKLAKNEMLRPKAVSTPVPGLPAHPRRG